MCGLTDHFFILFSLYILGYLESGGFGKLFRDFFHKLFKSLLRVAIVRRRNVFLALFDFCFMFSLDCYSGGEIVNNY